MLHQPSDDPFEATLSRAVSGDKEAINELFERFYPHVSRLVHQSLSMDLRRNRPWLSARFSTGDVVQEVFRTVLGDLRSFGGRTERAFAGYLAMVVRNRLIDAIRFHEAARRDGRRGTLPLMEQDQHDVPEAEAPERIAAANEEIDLFHAALAGLPEREQLLLRARFDGVASFADLTEQLGFTSTTATRRAFAAAQAKLVVRMGRDAQGESQS